MNHKVLAVAAVLIIVAAGAGIYILTDRGSEDGKSTAGQHFTDAAGRDVIAPDNLDKGIIAVGSIGPLRILSMFDAASKVVECDRGDVLDNKNGRAYSYAWPFDQITSYHADNALDTSTVESIAGKQPSLVIVGNNVWTGYRDNVEYLARSCTVMVLNNQSMTAYFDSDGKLESSLRQNIELVGNMVDEADRASEVISGIEGIISDIRSLSGTSDIGSYAAGLTISGSNSLNTTFPVYLPYDLTGATNAYKGGSTASKVVINIEDLDDPSVVDIDMIFIDPSSSDKVSTTDSQLFMKYIHGLNNDSDPSNDVRIYVTVPIVWDSINYDCVLASAYCISHILYGNLASEQVADKIANVFTTFYGEEHGRGVFDAMTSFFDDKSAAAGQELPLLSEIVIRENGGTYSFARA